MEQNLLTWSVSLLGSLVVLAETRVLPFADEISLLIAVSMSFKSVITAP